MLFLENVQKIYDAIVLLQKITIQFYNFIIITASNESRNFRINHLSKLSILMMKNIKDFLVQ